MLVVLLTAALLALSSAQSYDEESENLDAGPEEAPLSGESSPGSAGEENQEDVLQQGSPQRGGKQRKNSRPPAGNQQGPQQEGQRPGSPGPQQGGKGRGKQQRQWGQQQRQRGQQRRQGGPGGPRNQQQSPGGRPRP
ncbi:salivary acidic proline-rich phosphoprotein 1/2-like [Dipodomys merriami]|uniref:salivary acidic proline-rich phosphoprotein 1/2-like n=1 Tax=Dipodomys merriami TaxID=94247 RepID=UPI003855DC79